MAWGKRPECRVNYNRRNKMNGKFFDLSKEKQDRMINGALKVFAMQGYRHASTDVIVKEAGISKGLLFHYFGSKLGVYTFVYDYSVRFMTLELRSTVSMAERELFNLMEQVELARMHAMRAYPYMQQFLNRAAQENVTEALLATEKKREELEECYAKINAQADDSLLPVGTDVEKIKKMLELTVKGRMTECMLDESFQPELMYQEIQGYFRLMKELVYHDVMVKRS